MKKMGHTPMKQASNPCSEGGDFHALLSRLNASPRTPPPPTPAGHRSDRLDRESSPPLPSLTLSLSPLMALATFSPMLPLHTQESSMSPRYPATSAPLRGCTLLYAVKRSSLLDMALCTTAKVASFSLRSQFEMRPGLTPPAD